MLLLEVIFRFFYLNFSLNLDWSRFFVRQNRVRATY